MVQSLLSSKHYNCLVFENEVSPIFSLKWTKNRSPVLENTHESCDSNEEAFLDFQMNFSYYQDATLGWVYRQENYERY